FLRRALPSCGREAGEILGALPVEHESNETAALSLLVEGKVLIHKVDAAAETGQLSGEFLQSPEALDAAGSAADQYVVRDDCIPALELDALEGVVKLTNEVHDKLPPGMGIA